MTLTPAFILYNFSDRGLMQSPEAQDNSLDSFLSAVKSSVNEHAKRKNYTDSSADGDNKMVNVMVELGIHIPHSVGEIIYKCAEYMKTPRRVLMEKVAGWAFVIWREAPPE